MEKQRLTRKTSDQMVAGVCAGLADYLRIDVTIVRLVFFALLFTEGIGVLLYVLLWIILPAEGVSEARTLEERVEQGADEFSERVQALGEDLRYGGTESSQKTTLVLGAGLILVGLYYLLRVLPIRLPLWFDLEIVLPLIIIAGGVLLLVRRVREEDDD